MTSLRLLAALLTAATIANAQDAPQPEECVVRGRQRSVDVVHQGTTYRLASEACRAEFLTDPERYAQLYDALEELALAGGEIAAPAASLVPS